MLGHDPTYIKAACTITKKKEIIMSSVEAKDVLDNGQGVKHKGASKTARIPIKIVPLEEKLKKPDWIRAKIPTGKKFFEIKNILREQKMHTVCEEASCPNIGECFSHGTATFMIMGDICTRRFACAFVFYALTVV